MRSSNRPYLATVDHLRGFAALLVVAYHGSQIFTAQIANGNQTRIWNHSYNPLLTLIYEGHTGVALFMVLSGFIFTIGALDNRISYGRFMANRLLRIYPLFLVLLFLGIAAVPGAFTFAGFTQQVLGLGNMEGAANAQGVSAMFWAVAVEMQFYLLFPALNAVLRRFGPVTLLRIFAAIVVLRALVWAAAPPATSDAINAMLYFNIVGRIDQFLLGMFAAWVLVRRRSLAQGWYKFAAASVLALAMLWTFNRVDGFLDGNAWRLVWVDIEGVGWALVIVTYVATCTSQRLWSRALARIGELSYSTYLIHFMIITTLCTHDLVIRIPGIAPVHNALITTALIAIPLTLAISYVTYHGIERPFLQFRVKYLVPAEPQAAKREPALSRS